MGYGSAPHCLGCLAEGLNGVREEFRDRILAYVLERECYRTGWMSASELEGFGDVLNPGCLWPTGDDRISDSAPAKGSNVSDDTDKHPAVEWDAGDSGCGELVMELRLRLLAMKPGELLQLTARDPGAREDLPAWCRLTGHELVESRHPTYRIRRREE
jgi:tRNA 2-thiouridine synthesizing protein A